MERFEEGGEGDFRSARSARLDFEDVLVDCGENGSGEVHVGEVRCEVGFQEGARLEIWVFHFQQTPIKKAVVRI